MNGQNARQAESHFSGPYRDSSLCSQTQ
uniref:Uncharacterized protein n=1 Tax=Anguilla anguilla TaxID=7936 RepID=A0A0E9TCW7_ANGAN